METESLNSIAQALTKASFQRCLLDTVSPRRILFHARSQLVEEDGRSTATSDVLDSELEVMVQVFGKLPPRDFLEIKTWDSGGRQMKAGFASGPQLAVWSWTSHLIQPSLCSRKMW